MCVHCPHSRPSAGSCSSRLATRLPPRPLPRWPRHPVQAGYVMDAWERRWQRAPPEQRPPRPRLLHSNLGEALHSPRCSGCWWRHAFCCGPPVAPLPPPPRMAVVLQRAMTTSSPPGACRPASAPRSSPLEPWPMASCPSTCQQLGSSQPLGSMRLRCRQRVANSRRRSSSRSSGSPASRLGMPAALRTKVLLSISAWLLSS